MSDPEGNIDVSKLTQAAEELIDAVKAQVEVTSIALRQDAVQQVTSQESQLDALNHKLSSLEKNVTDQLSELSTDIKTMMKLQTKHQRLDWAFAANSEGDSFQCVDSNMGYCITDYKLHHGYGHDYGGETFRAKVTDQLEGLLGTTPRLEHADGQWMIYYE